MRNIIPTSYSKLDIFKVYNLMDKEDVLEVYIYNGILVIKKNEVMPFAATWMNLENIIISEVRQRKTNII